MFLVSINRFFQRDIDKLIQEIKSYKNEADLWKKQGEIKNSAGIICSHLIGNLNHFIGQGIGKTGYIRNRTLEFSIEFVPSNELIKMLEDAKVMIDKTLSEMDEKLLKEPKPLNFTVTAVETMMDYLIHLHSHLNWHLGQVNYHRRMLNG